MSYGNGYPVAGGQAGYAGGQTGQQAPGRHAADGERTVGLTADMTAAFRAGRPKDEAPPETLLAEWALWGKDEQNSGYHVMRCSKGDLSVKDFAEIITRFGSGVKQSLPQYTVCWIPGPQGPEYLAVEIHEVIDPDSPSAGGRKRNVGGRVVEYVRMFCFRYAEAAVFGPSYTDLVRAVADIPLVGGEGPEQLIRVDLPSGLEPPPPSDGERQLALEVALRLLTGDPVCILDAGGLPARQRLAFIDLVLSMLPFGMRATLSASTSASTTMQDLRLRLYFAGAPREDRRTSHVHWGRPARFKAAPGHEAARLYQEWLHEAKPGAIARLAEQTAAVRFTEADELEMLNRLPDDKSVPETLAELSDKLHSMDGPAVSAIVRRLQRYLAGPRNMADRAVFGSLILKHRLFREHAGIHGSTKSSVYRTLLTLGFGLPLSYADYAELEASAGGPPGWALRQVLMDNKTTSAAYILAGLAGPGISQEQVRDALAAEGIDAFGLLDLLARDVDAMRSQRHRTTLIDFTLWYLLTPADLTELWQGQHDPRAELYARGYLSSLLARAFPEQLTEQQQRLEDVIRYVHGERIGPGQVRDIFAAPGLYPSPALEAAVRRLVPPQLRRLVESCAAEARLRQAGHSDDVTKIMRSGSWHIPMPTRPWPWSRQGPPAGPERAKRLLIVAAVVLAVVAVILWLYLIHSRT